MHTPLFLEPKAPVFNQGYFLNSLTSGTNSAVFSFI